MTAKLQLTALLRKKSIAPILVAVAILPASAEGLRAQQSQAPSAPFLSARGSVPAPVVLCIDDKPKAGGKPSAQAYAKAAANGFRSVLTLRNGADGIDLVTERFMVEQNKLRFFNIPATAKLPSTERVDEFLRLARDHANQPMLINCAFAERVAPLMMIFRIVEQGWSRDKALKEAAAAGLKVEPLKQFATAYLAGRKIEPMDGSAAVSGKSRTSKKE